MEEKLVSFKLAKLAKEIGFNWPTLYFAFKNFNAGLNYIEVDSIISQFGQIEEALDHNNSNFELSRISLPTQSLLQKYLREVHKIHIAVLYIDGVLQFQAEICMMDSNTIVSDTKCGSYPDVLEEALEIALNLIKDDNNRS